MARKNKDPFSIAAERPLSEVGKSEAALEFEELAKERSIRNAAERLGTTPDALKKEAKEKGTNVLDLIKDKEKGASTKEKKPAATKLKKIQEQVQAESPAIDRTTEIERLKSEIKAGTYSVEDAAARAAGEIPAVTPAKSVEVAPTVKGAVKASVEKKKAEAAPLVEEKPAETVKETVSKTKQSSIRKTIAPESRFAIITAENPRFAATEGGNKALKKELEAKGYVVEQIKGMYDSLENPFLVKNASPEDIQALGKKYGQESVILADKNNYKMSYTAGPNEGKYHSANKINVFDTAPDNYYSTVIRDGKPVYFSIPFDMEKLEGGPAKAAAAEPAKSPAKKSVTVLKESPPPEPTKSGSKKPVNKPGKRKTTEETRTKLESEQAKFASQQMAAEGEAPKTPAPDIGEDQRRFGREQMAASGETPAPSPKPIAAEQRAAGAAASRVERTVQANQEKERKLAKESAEAKKAVEAEFKKITPTVVESAAKQAGVETSAVQKVVTEALETAAKQGKGAGEAIEQAAKGIPDKKTKLALGLIGAGLVGAAGYMASNQPETVKGLIGKGGFRPTPEGTTPLAPTPTGQIEDVSKPIVEKQEPKKVIDEADESTKEVDEYIINEVPRKNQPELQSAGQTLREKLENAKTAYRKGVDNVMLMKALEKIAEGLALWGAGAYGMKHGVDAVSGLKFSPIDWSDKMKALEKELDLAESEYTKGIELEEKEKKEKADSDIEQQKEAKEQQKLVRGATVKQLEEADKRADSTIKAIDAGLNQMKTAQFQKMDDAEKEGALLAAASSAGIPIEAMRKEKGILFWKGQKFDEETARNVLLQQKKAVQALKNTISNQLFKARSGEEITGSEEAPAAMVRVQAADGRVGQIPENKVEQFLKDNPGSKRL